MGKSTAALLTDFLSEAQSENLEGLLTGKAYLDPRDDSIYLRIRDFLLFVESSTGEIWTLRETARRLSAVSGQCICRNIDGQRVNLYCVRRETLNEILASELAETVSSSRSHEDALENTRAAISGAIESISASHKSQGLDALLLVGVGSDGSIITSYAYTGVDAGLALLGLIDVQKALILDCAKRDLYSSDRPAGQEEEE